MIAPTFKARSASPAVWRPGATPTPPPQAVSSPLQDQVIPPAPPQPPPPPIWTPQASPQSSRKSYRPVHFESPVLPARGHNVNSTIERNGSSSALEPESRMKTSHSAPASGLNSLVSSSPGGNKLPKVQNPTVTLLQKGREGLLSRGASYLQEHDSDRLPRDRASPPKGDPIHALRREYASEGEEHIGRGPRKMPNEPRVEGIGPTTKDGMPVALRSEVKDQSRWYKRMYDTIHKNKYDDDYVTIRYKNRRDESQPRPSSRSQCAYFDPRSGYLSEPEGGMRRPGSSWSDAYDSDAAHAPRRRTTSVQGDRRNDDDVSSPYLPSTKYSTLASARARQEVYKNQPGRIENYVPGKSSVVDKESKMWWDEVMDIFDGWDGDNTPLPPYATLLVRASHKRELTNSNAPTQSTPGPKKNLTSSILSKSNMARALRETGYESDSQLVFRRHEETNGPLSPAERRAAYKDVQAGGEVPFRGLRSPAPPRQDDTELEYIPLSPTLTKIRVHKTPNYQEIICYPITTIELDRDKPKKRTPSFITVDLARNNVQSVPKPPKRISSRKPKTLNMIKLQKSNNKLNQPSTSISNVGILKEKINQKLTRQNTLILKKCNLLKKPSQLKPKSRSSSSINIEESKNSAIIKATSMSQTNLRKSDKCKLGQTRNILSPLQYTNPGLRKIHPSSSESEIIVGGAGRRTPVTNILDKVTSLDKLWSSDKRNQQVDKTKAKASLSKSRSHSNSKSNLLIQSSTSVHNLPKVTRGREIMRTADKIQKFKVFDHSILSQKISIATHNMNKQKKIPENSLVPNLSKECKKYKSLEALKSRSVNSHKQNLPSKNEKSLNSKSLKTGKRHLKGYDKHQSSNKNIKKNMEDVSRFPLSAEEIKETRDSIISDSFFQHLLFKNYPYLVCPLEFESDVLRKAKVFESFHHHNCYSKPANTLLINRKPVTTSKFKINDQYKSNKYCSRSISCPSKFQEDSRKLFYSRYGSTSSLGSLRSRSEPRVDRFYFSQTSRPKFPVINYALKKRIITNSERTSSPTKIISSETSRPISSHTRYVKQNNEQMHLDRSLSVSPTRIILTETIRPISPVVTKNYKSECVKNIKYRSQESLRSDSPFYYHDYSRSHSSSPVPPRSPSYRRINSTRKKISGVVRTKSAGDAETNMPLNYQCNKSYSETNICNNELLCQSRKERFRELSKYYNYLERVGELEKKTSSCDLRHRKKNEEIIDFDRWRKVRSIERAETELRNLQSFLRKAQIEKDVLFYPRDVNELRWSYERDHGLKMKEKSVEDLREHFQAHPCTSSVMSNCSTNDFYKPLWRGKSVIESAFSIDRNIYDKPKDYIQKYSFEDHLHSQSSDLQNEIGLGNNIWSSLSSEQINVLKNQLNEIFGKDMKKNNEEFSIDVSNAKVKSSNVYVRSNSLISLPEPQKTTISKSGSIAFIPTTSTTNNKLCKKTTALSESEKIKMSQALSKEVLNKIKTNSNVSLESLETNAIKNTDRSIKITEIPKINKKHSTELSQSDPNNDHRVSYSEGIISHPSSASETETASSDISNKTVIHNEPNNKVLKKVAYFESAKKEENATTIYLPRDEEDRHTPENRACLVPYKNLDSPRPLSQSCSDLSELFGESEKSKFLSLPPNRNRLSRSRSPGSEIYVNSRRTLNTLLHPSEEAIFRSRSPSPRVERYWQAYLNLAKAGEVRRLARKFESSWPIRRHCSDSDLTCDILSAGGKLHYHKQRDKLGPVTRVPLRACNRLMPHIDIISKLASLRRRTFDSKYKSPDEYIECRRGEVDRIRRRFEVMSMFGQIYSSAPDVSQLKDIAPYLSGSWIAHRYPKISDNYKNIDNKNKSLKNNNHKESNPVKLNSILHNEKTIVTYNPEIHKPSHRYEPPRNPPRPPPAAWSSWIEPFISSRRNMVKFKESPRRYVESDVNIHYKCPVRRDPLPHVPERELARQQAEHMKRLYREQKRTKYLQDLDINPDDIEAFDASIKELQDMQNRRHQDNFTPSQKTVVPLNRYDDAEKTVAKALYNFTGNTPRELSFKKGDFITVRRQYDENWYEGELHGRIGLFPYTFVEIQRGEGMNVSAPISQQPSTQPTILEGRARALYNFKGQTVLELPMKQGEIVVLRKRVDHNWWEGRNGKKTGIIPNNYIEVLQEPTQITNNGVQNHSSINVDKPLASPASHGLVGATARSSMGSHSYTPQLNSPNLANGPQATQPLPSYKAKPAHASLTPSERGYGPPTTPGVNLNNTEPLYIDTNAKAVPFRVLYPYQPQHSDEMELAEGDTVYVLEVCDDGWCVGSSQRTGRFGTFPGNYVERI